MIAIRDTRKQLWSPTSSVCSWLGSWHPCMATGNQPVAMSAISRDYLIIACETSCPLHC